MSGTRSLIQNARSKRVRFGGNVSEILLEYKEGYTENYKLLLNQLQDPTSKSSQMVEWFQQCSKCAHLMDKSYSEIVNTLLKVKWMEREDAVMSEYSSFVISLAATNPVHLRSLLNTLISCFIPNQTKKSDSILHINTDLVHSTIHEILKTLFTLIPQSVFAAEHVFSACFPYMKKPTKSLTSYVKNLLMVTEYRLDLRSHILELIVKNLIALDVHSPRQEIYEKEDEENEEDETLFAMDEDLEATTVAMQEMKHPLANKLDILMHMLLQYMYDICYKNGELQLQMARKLFREVVAIFDEVILPVHQLVHVQFIVFYICSFKQSFNESYVEHCWKKVTNVSNSTILRQSAVCYIASLVSRAKYVPLSTTTACLDTMTAWAHSYLKESTDVLSYDGYRCDVIRHGTFYSVCQAIFYIVVFRHKQILNSKLGYPYIESLNLQHLIVSQLNPLKVCLSSIVALFASIMRQHQLLYCDTIVERNNRQLLPIVGVSALSSVNPLESFFPFDPYLLKRSSVFIESHYKEWEGRNPDVHDVNGKDAADDEFLDAMETTFGGSLTSESISKPIITPSPLSSGFGLITPSPF